MRPTPWIFFFAMGLICSCSRCMAATVPFTEDFTANVANWADNSGLNLLSHVLTGGPDGGSFASSSLSLLNLGGQDIVLFRAHDEFNSSGHAFEGNWIADGVGRFSTYVRHNAPMPLNFFTRFSGPGNFPGAVAVEFIPALPNVWTQFSFYIRPDNPEFVTFEGMSFDAAFSDVGHVQVGVSVPTALGATPNSFTFGIDKPSLAVPEPVNIVIGLVSAIPILACRRTRRD